MFGVRNVRKNTLIPSRRRENLGNSDSFLKANLNRKEEMILIDDNQQELSPLQFEYVGGSQYFNLIRKDWLLVY